MARVDIDRFFEWHSPQALLAGAESLGAKLGHMAMRRPGTAYREAFVASRFAKHRGSELVRLLPPRKRPTPDFALKLAGEELWYETTEVDRPGRKRGLEYADESSGNLVEQIPDEHWVEPDAYQAVIHERCVQKASKRYDKCDGLIIWSNAFPIGNEDQLNTEWWIHAIRAAQGSFPEVWRHFRGEFSRIS